MSLKPYTITAPISGSIQISGSGIHASKYLVTIGTFPTPGTEEFLNIIDTDTTTGVISFQANPVFQPGQIQIFKNISGSNTITVDGGLGDLNGTNTIKEFESYIVMADPNIQPECYFTISSYKLP